jgi:anthranilate/para-aminobenzoate synthase component II
MTSVIFQPWKYPENSSRIFDVLDKRLGNGLIATQYSTDKKRCIEAIQHETLPIYAFQYHPEHGSRKNAGKKIIRWFIAQCR